MRAAEQKSNSEKFVTAAVAARAVRPGDTVDFGFSAGFADLMDEAIADRREELTDVTIRGGLVIGDRIRTVESDPEQKAFHYVSWHIGDTERKLQSKGLVTFLPMILRYVPYYFRHGDLRCDVACVPVSTPDADGFFGLGISNFAWRAILESARTVIFEVNEHYPTLHGVDGSHRVHVSEADFVVEGPHAPLPTRSYPEPSKEEIRIAQHVLSCIPNGATLSLGVGGVPFTVAKMVAESELMNIGCHTGTLSDAFLAIHRAGKLTNSKKAIDTGLSTWNLATGSAEFYEWLREEPDIFRPDSVDYVHDPARIAQMKNVVSINGGVEVDLLGQENAESNGHRQLSGTGGQLDFLEGAFRSDGGKGFICMKSTYTRKDGSKKSSITAQITPGSVVSAPRALVQYVATEYGVANLAGKTVPDRARSLIAIAHPDFREELTQAAISAGLIK